MRAYHDKWLWRSDITKFFDSIDHDVLMRLIGRQVSGPRALWLLATVMDGGKQAGIGLAIGNLTSQIAANIYLHEYDRYVQHTLRPLGYVRYGDDMVLWCKDEQQAVAVAEASKSFLDEILHLRLNPNSTTLQPVQKKLRYLGMEFWPSGHRLDRRMRARLPQRVTLANLASYDALARGRGTRSDRHALLQVLLRDSATNGIL